MSESLEPSLSDPDAELVLVVAVVGVLAEIISVGKPSKRDWWPCAKTGRDDEPKANRMKTRSCIMGSIVDFRSFTVKGEGALARCGTVGKIIIG